MWIVSARLDPRDAYEPGETEIGLTVAHAEALGDAIDTHASALRCGDVYTGLDPYALAAARTDADAEHLAAALEVALASPAEPAEVVDLDARRRRARPRTELRAA